jgi:WD40 repeat protein
MAIDVFLCHNSRDKDVVRQVAEGLELEFGIPHFLDTYSIPTGEAFLPWIEDALAQSTGCAIFLGAHGWGPTHLWEAERAMERYRRDPAFKVIPVALPGIRDEDMRRLGEGTLFSEINWADFRAGVIDEVAIEKLRAALQGSPVSPGVGPPRLTPYQVRRDAARWERSERKDKSIPYRGKQLAAAQLLLQTQPDLMSGASIAAFIAEATQARATRLRNFGVVAALTIVVISLLAVGLERSRRIALSRFLAAEARQSASPDRSLLLGIHSYAVSETAEAAGALVERVDALPYLRHYLRLGSEEVTALTFDESNRYVYVGGASGSVRRFGLDGGQSLQVRLPDGNAVQVLDVDPTSGEVWAGTLDGRVLVLGEGGEVRSAAVAVNVPRRNSASGAAESTQSWPVIALRVDDTHGRIAVGDHRGRLTVLDRKSLAVHWTVQFDDQRVTALAFSPEGSVVAAATNGGPVYLFDAASGSRTSGFTTAASGEAVSLEFARNGTLRAIDKGGMQTHFVPRTGEVKRSRVDGNFLSSATVGPRKEYGPRVQSDQLVLGYASGRVSFTPAMGQSDAIALQGHEREVLASALSPSGRYAATGSADGTVAVWDLLSKSPVVDHPPVPGGEILAAGWDPRAGHAMVVTTTEDAAGYYVQDGTGWRTAGDLRTLSESVAGGYVVSGEEAKPDAEGFVELLPRLVTDAALSADGRCVAWTTRGGGLFWMRLGLDERPRLLQRDARGINVLALSASCRYAYFATEERVLRRFETTATGETAFGETRLPEVARAMVAGLDEGQVHVTLDDGRLITVDFGRLPPIQSPRALLKGAAAVVARVDGADTLIASGAGASAGTEVSLMSASEPPVALRARRLGGGAASLGVSARAGLIAAGDQEGRLHLWDLTSRVPVASLTIAENALTHVSFAPNGKKVMVASVVGDVFFVDMDRTSWGKAACRMVQRDFSAEEWQMMFPGETPVAVCEIPVARSK